MIVHLLRHGMTIANEKRLYYGSTDLPLSEKGVTELERLKSTITLPIADCHITSGLRRAKESLRILFDKTPQKTIEELNEYDFGDFEMKSHDELKDEPAYLHWIAGNDDTPCPNGESKNRFAKRVMQGFEVIKKTQAENIVVVCHGGVIGTLIEHLFPGQKEHYYEWVPECGRGFSVEMDEESFSYRRI